MRSQDQATWVTVVIALVEAFSYTPSDGGSAGADGCLGCIEHSSTFPATAIALERMGVSEAASTVRGGVSVGVLPRAAELRRRRRDTRPLRRG